MAQHVVHMLVVVRDVIGSNLVLTPGSYNQRRKNSTYCCHVRCATQIGEMPRVINRRNLLPYTKLRRQGRKINGFGCLLDVT